MTATLHPERAIRYYQGDHRGNEVPAILWLFAAVVLILVIRNGALPTASQALTLAIAAAVVVGIGTVAPDVVVLVLVALLIAGVLDVPAVGPFLSDVERRVAALSQG